MYLIRMTTFFIVNRTDATYPLSYVVIDEYLTMMIIGYVILTIIVISVIMINKYKQKPLLAPYYHSFSIIETILLIYIYSSIMMQWSMNTLSVKIFKENYDGEVQDEE